MSKTDVTITITVDGRNYNLSGIPAEAFKAFMQNTKQHFPDAGEDAWASALTEVILSFTSFTSYFMTDIPEENSRALEAVMERVGWTFEQFHAYLLYAALKEGALRIISFHEEDKSRNQLGTLIITGLRRGTFTRIESLAKVSTETVMGLMFKGFERGEVTFTPDDAFVKANGP